MAELNRNTNAQDIAEDIKHIVEDTATEEAHFQKRFNRWIYLIGIVGVVFVVPQIIKIYTEQIAAGVSFISWGAYLAVAAAWFGYGVVYKHKSIAITYGIWMILNISVLYGIFFFG